MAFVQAPTPYASESTTATTGANTFALSNTSGNCLLAFVSWYTGASNNITVTSVADNQGNTWTQVMTVTDTADNQASSLYTCFNCAGGAAATVTATFSATTVQVGVTLAEYSNAASLDVFQSKSNVAASTSYSTASITTNFDGEQIVGFLVNDDSNDLITASGSGTTSRARTTTASYPMMLLEDNTQTTAGSISLTATAAVSTRYTALILALKAPTGGGLASGGKLGFIKSYDASQGYTSNAATKTVSVTTQPGDCVVVYGGGENSAMTLTTPVGNGITFSLAQSVVTANFCTAYLWTGTDGTGGTWTLTCTSAGGNTWGFTCVVFRGVAGFGLSAKANVNSGSPTLSFSTATNNSYFVLFDADFNADPISPRVWNTVNGYTPNSSNGYELTAAGTTSTYGAYGAYYANLGTAGSKTFGMSAPTPQIYSILGIEVLPAMVATLWFRPYLGGTLEFIENFEDASSGTTASTSNTTFDTIAGGGTGVFDGSNYADGQESLLISSPGTSGNQYYLRHILTSVTNQTYMRWMMYLPSIPGAPLVIAGANTASTDSTPPDQANIIINSSAKVQLFDAGAPGVDVSSNAVPIGKWFCMEWKVDFPGGQQTVKFYNDIYGTTLIETLGSGSNYDGSGVTTFKIGNINNPQNSNLPLNYSYWIDSVAISHANWVGPV
jgi:hypothetical protein